MTELRAEAHCDCFLLTSTELHHPTTTDRRGAEGEESEDSTEASVSSHLVFLSVVHLNPSPRKNQEKEK